MDVYNYPDNDQFWIGLTDTDEEGTFQWSEGGTSDRDIWYNLENKDCVYAYVYYDAYDAAGCDLERIFLCEWEPPID